MMIIGGTTGLASWLPSPPGKKYLVIVMVIVIVMVRVSSPQFSYWLGQAGIVHIGLDQRVLTVVSEIRENKDIVIVVVIVIVTVTAIVTAGRR